MAHETRVHPEHRFGLVRFSGEVDGSDLLRAIVALYLDEAWDAHFDVVWDARAVDRPELRPEDGDRVANLAGRFSYLIEGGRTAVLYDGEIDENTVNMLIRLSERKLTREARLFRAGAEAAAWLGVPEAVIETL